MRNALEIGKAAEYLVCADLLLAGYVAYPSDQGLPYDLVVDVDGTLLRIQVKSTLAPRNVNAAGRRQRLAYSWHVRRRGKGGAQRLGTEHCDIIAAVAIDIRVIAYFPVGYVGQTLQLAPPGCAPFSGDTRMIMPRSVDCYPIDEALAGSTPRVAPRDTHCRRGHLLAVGGFRIDSRGSKICRTCEQDRMA